MDLSVSDMDVSENENMERTFIEEMEMTFIEEDEIPVDLFQIYPHDVQMYSNQPSGQISLIDFETLGVERLRVLRVIDRISKEAEIKSGEFKECVLSALKYYGLDFYVKLIRSPGCDSNTLADIEGRRREHISHFVLRLSLCRKIKTRSWFLNLEQKLFEMRFESLNRKGLETFLALNNFDFPTLSEEERQENREDLVAVYENVDVDGTVFFKVPYLRLRKLVKERKAFIKRGIAFVPSTAMINIVSQTFRDDLKERIFNMKGTVKRDRRLEPIFQNLLTFTIEVLLPECSPFPISSIDEVANTSFPLCMRTMHKALRNEHHLKNGARFQYGLFLKLIGINYNTAVDFWKEEFLRKIDLQTFEQRYLYHIKHTYGKVGRRVNYQFLSCKTIIDSNVGFGEYHGCPYKNMTEDTLRENLQTLGLENEDIVEIEDLAGNDRYREACTKCFEGMYKTILSDPIISPANFFSHSQDYILREKSIREQEEKKKASGDLNLTLDGNPLELSTWNYEPNEK